MNEGIRQTGRTAIMLKDTIDHVLEGNDAVIVGATQQQCRDLARRFQELLVLHEPHVKMVQQGSMEFRVKNNSVRFMSRDEVTGGRGLRGMHGLHIVKDHYVTEDMDYAGYRDLELQIAFARL